MKRGSRLEQLQLQLEEERSVLDLTQKLIAIGLQALSARMLAAFALAADSVLFVWAMVAGTWQAVAVAVLFAISAWAVLYLKPRDREET